MPPKQPKPPSPIELRRLALDALVDLRTLQRALRGQRVQHLSRERIRRALVRANRAELLPDAAEGAR